jgi:hypothetical protein
VIPKPVLLVLTASIVATTGAYGAKPTPTPSSSALAIYDSANARVAQVIDGTSAILSSGGKHYVTPVALTAATSPNGNVVVGFPYERLYTSSNCTGQAYYRYMHILDGGNYLTQGGSYIVESRPDGIYLTLFANVNSLSGLPFFSLQEYNSVGQLICRSGAGFGQSAAVVEVEQASGPATNVGGAGPYTVR